MSKRELSLILKWYENHKDDLIVNWNLSKDHKTLNKIPPLL